jgi:hypothetical protein
MCSKRNYLIKKADGGDIVGKITNLYNGVCYEMFTRADNYGIEFPPDADLNMKMVLV